MPGTVNHSDSIGEVPLQDLTGDRRQLVSVGMAAVFAACITFGAARFISAMSSGRATPWWANAAGAVLILLLYLWFRRRPEKRSTLAAHGTAAVATAALLIPLAYGMKSSIWWLSLVGFAMVLLGRRGEALGWGIGMLVLITIASLVTPRVQVRGAAGESALEEVMARVVFAALLLAMAAGFRALANQRALALRRSEEAVRRADERLRQVLTFQHTLLETTPAMIYTYNVAGVFQTANRAAHLAIGLPEGGLPGRPLSDFLSAKSARGLSARIARLVSEGEIHGEVGLITVDGSRKVVEFRNRVVDGDGEPLLLGTALDVTERRRLERTLGQAVEELAVHGAILEAVVKAAERLFQAASWENVAGEVLADIGNAVKAGRASIFQTFDDEQGKTAASLRVHWVAPGGPPLPETMRQAMSFEESGFARWLESFGRGEAIHGPVRHFPEQERAILSGNRVVSLAAIPVRRGGQLWGFLAIDDCEAEREWPPVAILALRLAADTLGAAIESENRAVAVAASEERYRVLFEKSLGYLCTHSLDGTILTVNDAAPVALGLPKTALVGHNLAELLRPDWLPELANYLAAIAESGERSGLMSVVDGAGRERVWQYRNLLIHDQGREPYVVGHAIDVTDRIQMERDLRERAATDPLTGVANRTLLEDRLRRAVERCKREAPLRGALSPLAVVYVDLDGFKSVNDRFGHAAGDAVLREVADRLRRGVRMLDTVARPGGDEFVLLLPDIGSVAATRRLLDKLLASLRRPIFWDGSHLSLKVSIGVSMFPGDGEASDTLIARADEAMYEAKIGGGNTYRFVGAAD